MSPPETVTIIGAGAMGAGLAVQLGLHDVTVTVADHRQENLDRAHSEMRSIVGSLNNKGFTKRTPGNVLTEIEFSLDLQYAVEGADLVLESVSEDLATKREIFEKLGNYTTDAVLATNTSSLSITDIANATPDAADRVVGCHWWYPPYLLRPVEIVAGDQTSENTILRATTFVESVNCDPITVQKDVPGFVWNRIQFAVLRECMHIVDEGVASIEDVNLAVRDGYARRTSVIGPFETVDIAGLELFKTIAGHLYPHLSDNDSPSPLFDDHLDRNRGGVKDGAGFFSYDETPDTITRHRDERLLSLRKVLDTKFD